MQWYYGSEGQQKGPVSEVEFDALIRSGVIRPETLVWRVGMAAWLPYAQVQGQAAPESEAQPPAIPVTARPAAPSAGVSAPPPGQPVSFDFKGNAAEFFPIWIVNLLLTIVTFGIYAAWAKVRTRRYLYGNTQLAGHAFEYLADPIKILKGNLIVVGVFMVYSLSGMIAPWLQLLMMLALAPAIPWFIVSALRFNARNSAWRGLKFHFSGRYKEALVVFILLPLATGFTFGLLYPYVLKRQKEFVANHHTYGSTSFVFSGLTGDFYRICGIALLFFLPVIVLYIGIFVFAVAGAVRGAGQPPPAFMAGIGLGVFIALPLALAGAFYLRSRLFNYVWSNTALGDHRFEAGMRARDLLWIHLSNSFVVAATFGLMYPWAAIRSVRYRLSCLQLVPAGNLDNFVASSQANVSALGEAASDFLDIDLGFGL